MPKVDFESLPDDARLWVFGTERALDAAEEEHFLATVDRFLQGWQAHGSPLTCGRDWRHGRFLLVGVDERTAPPSGCSIDAMVHVLKGLEEGLGLRLVDNSPIWFRGAEGPQRVDRASFRKLVDDGEVGPETQVFDNTVTRLSQLREEQWERPARESWHARAFAGLD